MTLLFRRCYTVPEFHSVGQGAHGLDETRAGAKTAYSPVVSDSATHRGARLGLPAEGPGSIAGFGRRLVAVIVDWVLCELIAVGLLHADLGGGSGGSFMPLAVFAVENVLLVGTVGSTIGHRLLGMRVVPAAPGFFPLRVLVRTALLCLFFPALFSDSDGRGLHDRFAGTAIVRL